MERRLSGHYQAQAKVRDYRDIGRDLIVLQSYWTDVIYVEDGWMDCTGLYSRTTIKHIGWFLRDYFPNISYYTVKKIAGTGKRLNVETGEVK